MAQKKKYSLSIRVNDRERTWGFVYLLLSLLVMPYLLQYLNGLLPLPLSKVWFNFIQFALNFCFVFWIFADFFKRSLVYISHNIPDFLLAVSGGLVAYFASSWGLSLLIRLITADFSNLNDSSIAGMAQDNFTISLVSTVFLVPLAEETLHRGLIFGSLYPKNHWLAYLVSTAVFAVIHIVGYIGIYGPLELALAFLQYIPAGLVLAWAYRKSGSIFAPVLIHTVINAVGMLSLR